MKVSFAALMVAFASIAYSQIIAREVAQIPSCALRCMTTAISSAGCGLSDYACQCGTSKDSINSLSAPCLATACSASDVKKVRSIRSSICEAQLAPGGKPASVSFADKVELRAEPTGSFVSGIGGYPTTKPALAATTTTTRPAPVGATSTSSSVSTTTSSPAGSSPSVVLSNSGNRLQAGGFVGAAVAFLTLVW